MGLLDYPRVCCKFLSATIFTYSTIRSASVNSLSVVITHRAIQLIILSYVIGYDIILNKGYQKVDIASSTVTTKVKGLGYIQSEESFSKIGGYKYFNGSDDDIHNGDFRIFDTSDYIVPPNEYNSVFIMTNFVETKQTLGFCDEATDKLNVTCEVNSDCLDKYNLINTWSGIPTGRCVESNMEKNVKVCEVNAWCPVENDKANYNEISNTLTYTIFIKNDVEFKAFKRKEHNIVPGTTNEYLSQCRNNPNDTLCPVFRISDVLKIAEPDEDERTKMLKKGGIIQAEITWSCNYDYFSTPCIPIYNFKRFDAKFKDKSASSGFNFRFSNKFILNGTEHRTLYKAYGLRFIINVSGQAGKFSILPFMLTIGAGFGLLAISEAIADLVLLNCTNKRKLFQKIKELDAKDIIRNPELLEKGYCLEEIM